jgi:uncharacterized protein YecT (DUF1311 family)
MVNIIGEPKMRDNDQLLALERLTKLRDAGTLSEDEFLKQKERIIGEAAPVKSYRRLWLVVLLTCLIITSPIAFLILITGDVYRRNRDLSFRPMKRSNRFIYAGALVVWFLAAGANAIIHPGVLNEEIAATNTKSSEQQVSAEDPLPKCDDADAIGDVKDSLENTALSKLIQVKVLDMGHEQEIYYDKIKTARYCKAQAELNTGSTAIVYKFYMGPSGAKLVLVNKDAAAFDDEIAAAKETSAEAQQAKQQPAQPTASAVPAPQTSAPAEPQQTAKAERSAPTDPLEPYYTPAFKTCMATGDAANGSTQGMLDCTNAELTAQDGLLNQTYKSVMASLSPDKQTELRDSERVWIKEQAIKCPEGHDTGGDLDRLDKPSCLLAATIQRTQDLKKLAH